MLKPLSSSCLQGKFQTLNSTIQPAIRHGCNESTSPILRVLTSFTGFNRKGPNLGRRAAFFCSASNEGKIDVETKATTEVEAEEADSNSSSAIVPTNPKPEDYLTVIALPLPHRPLFPGFYLPLYVKDPKLLAALRESRKRQAPYAGAFLVKEEPGTDSQSSGSESEKNISDLKGKELFDRLHEVGTLAQITSIQGDQVVLVGHVRLRIIEMVSEDPLQVKVDHLKEKPYDKDDDVIKATLFEVISTLKDAKRTSLIRASLNSHNLNNHTSSSSFTSSSSNPTIYTKSSSISDDPFDIFTISELINKQHWSKFKTLIKDTNPNTVLQKLFDYDADSDVILRYYKWSEKEFRVLYNLEFSFRLLHLLLNSKKYRNIRAFLDGFVKNGIHSNSSIFHMLSLCSDQIGANSVIVDMLVLAYARNSRTDLAFEGFERAGDYGFKLSVLSCNPLLSCLVQEGKIGTVEVVYKEMIRRRIRLDVITFNIVINGLCKVGKLQKGEDVLEDMKGMGISPSVISYNTLIYGYCKSSRVGKLYKADALLKEMESDKICPNEVTYNVLIDGFCKDENVMAAMKIFEEMQTKMNLKPGVFTYNSLINGLCSEGKIEEALRLKDEMLGMDLKPDVVTYNALINGFSKKKMLKEARELFDDIVKQGSNLIPSVITFNTLIDGYCKAGGMDEATALHSMMLNRGVLPIASTYNCLIAGFCREKNKEAVHKLLSEMKEKGLKANVVTYNILIGAFCKEGESRKGIRLLDEMIEMGLCPSHITYNTLMDGYCMEGNLRAALNLRVRMEKAGKRANVVTYNVLIKGLCKKGKLEDANGLLNEMLEKGLIPNRTTYEIVREEMMEKGFNPDIEGHLYNASVSS